MSHCQNEKFISCQSLTNQNDSSLGFDAYLQVIPSRREVVKRDASIKEENDNIFMSDASQFQELKKVLMKQENERGIKDLNTLQHVFCTSQSPFTKLKEILPLKKFDEILLSVKLQQSQANEVIWKQGSNKQIYVLLRGSIQLCKQTKLQNKQNTQQVQRHHFQREALRLRNPGELFGGNAMLLYNEVNGSGNANQNYFEDAKSHYEEVSQSICDLAVLSEEISQILTQKLSQFLIKSYPLLLNSQNKHSSIMQSSLNPANSVFSQSNSGKKVKVQQQQQDSQMQTQMQKQFDKQQLQLQKCLRDSIIERTVEKVQKKEESDERSRYKQIMKIIQQEQNKDRNLDSNVRYNSIQNSQERRRRKEEAEEQIKQLNKKQKYIPSSSSNKSKNNMNPVLMTHLLKYQKIPSTREESQFEDRMQQQGLQTVYTDRFRTFSTYQLKRSSNSDISNKQITNPQMMKAEIIQPNSKQSTNSTLLGRRMSEDNTPHSQIEGRKKESQIFNVSGEQNSMQGIENKQYSSKRDSINSLKEIKNDQNSLKNDNSEQSKRSNSRKVQFNDTRNEQHVHVNSIDSNQLNTNQETVPIKSLDGDHSQVLREIYKKGNLSSDRQSYSSDQGSFTSPQLIGSSSPQKNLKNNINYSQNELQSQEQLYQQAQLSLLQINSQVSSFHQSPFDSFNNNALSGWSEISNCYDIIHQQKQPSSKQLQKSKSFQSQTPRRQLFNSSSEQRYSQTPKESTLKQSHHSNFSQDFKHLYQHQQIYGKSLQKTELKQQKTDPFHKNFSSSNNQSPARQIKDLLSPNKEFLSIDLRKENIAKSNQITSSSHLSEQVAQFIGRCSSKTKQLQIPIFKSQLTVTTSTQSASTPILSQRESTLPNFTQQKLLKSSWYQQQQQQQQEQLQQYQQQQQQTYQYQLQQLQQLPQYQLPKEQKQIQQTGQNNLDIILRKGERISSGNFRVSNSYYRSSNGCLLESLSDKNLFEKDQNLSFEQLKQYQQQMSNYQQFSNLHHNKDKQPISSSQPSKELTQEYKEQGIQTEDLPLSTQKINTGISEHTQEASEILLSEVQEEIPLTIPQSKFQTQQLPKSLRLRNNSPMKYVQTNQNQIRITNNSPHKYFQNNQNHKKTLIMDLLKQTLLHKKLE